MSPASRQQNSRLLRRCSSAPPVGRPARRTRRRAFTVIEMVISVGLVGMIGVAMATLSTAAHMSNTYVQDTGDAIQHARVAIERIRQAVREAHASDDFPGFVVVENDVVSWTFYDTLAVWKPTGSATDPDGLPTVEELVLFTFDSSDPTRLLEITLPGDTSTVPVATDTSGWTNLIASMKADADVVEVELTDMLDCGKLAGQQRGVLQFSAVHHPSESEWADYVAGNTNFEDLPWVLDIHSASSGLRQSRVSFDFQLQSDRTATATSATVIPFFGSAAIYYEMTP